MKISLDKKETYTVLSVLEGKLNTLVAPDLKTSMAILNNEGIKNIILDLSEVTFVDSSGLSAILVANRLCQNAGGLLVITEVTDNVKRLVKISQLDSVLTLIPTLQEAKDYIKMEELMKELRGDNNIEEDTETTEEKDEDEE